MFFLYLFKDEIKEGKFNVGAKVISQNFEEIPDYNFFMKGALLSENPDHVIFRNLDNKILMIIEDNSSDKSFIRAGVQCSFYLASYTNENFLRSFYGMVTNFEEFQFVKYVKNLNKISLSRIYLPYKYKSGEKTTIDYEEIRKICKITRSIVLKNDSVLI